MTDFKAVLMVSRNKDNKDVKGFKQRSRALLMSIEDLANLTHLALFKNFVQEGQKGELSRLYVSVNRRDVEKAKNKLIIHLLSGGYWMCLDGRMVSKAMEKDCDLDGKWLLDVDTTDSAEIDQMFDILKKHFDITQVYGERTLNGYAIVLPHGFDSRELLAACPNVENKKDGMLFVCAQEKE